MRKLLFALFLLASAASFGQVNYTNPQPSLPGIKYQRVKSDSVQPIPRKFKTQTDRDTTPHLFFHYDTLYQRVGGVVSPVASSAGSVVVSDSLGNITRLKAKTSAGGAIYSNNWTLVAEWGAGGGANFDFHGFAGYNANRSASYTARSFTDKNYVDSADALRVVKEFAFTNRRVPFVNNLGQLKDTAGFEYESGFLKVTSATNANALSITGFTKLTADGPDSESPTLRVTSLGNGSGIVVEKLNTAFNYAIDVRSGFSNFQQILATSVQASGGFFGQVVTATQPNITSLGTLTALTVSGGINTGSIVSGTINTSDEINLTANAKYIRGRNAANTLYYALIGVDGSNNVVVSADNQSVIMGGSGTAKITAGKGNFSDSLITSDQIFLNNAKYIRWFNSGGTRRAVLGMDASDNVVLSASNDPVIIGGSGTASLSAGSINSSVLGTGTVYSLSGTLTNTNPSDSTLKNSITAIPYGLSHIMQLKPKTFYYNSDSAKTSLKYGFIAQEVKSIMPSIVRKLNPKDPKSKLGLETDGIYVTMVKAIQELSAENDTIKAELAELKAILKQKGIL